MTLACEDDNSKLVENVTVVDVDDEKRVDNCLVQIWKFGQEEILKLGLVNILNFKLSRETDVWSIF